MIYWHPQAYLGEGIKEKYKDIRVSLENNRPSADVYIIALSSSRYEQLDIFSSYMFISNLRYNPEPTVVGIAYGRSGAEELVSVMAFDIYSLTDKIDFKEYFKTGLT